MSAPFKQLINTANVFGMKRADKEKWQKENTASKTTSNVISNLNKVFKVCTTHFMASFLVYWKDRNNT